jgi:hypothetical protein
MEDNLSDAQQRINFGEFLCSKKKQVFQFKGMLENVSISMREFYIHMIIHHTMTGQVEGALESLMII